VLIKVTQDHINRALEYRLLKEGCRTQNCPVALALKDATGHNWTVNYAFCHISRLQKNYYHTEPVAQWIVDFDNNIPVEPFEFELAQG
jgi:hypothetical protein